MNHEQSTDDRPEQISPANAGRFDDDDPDAMDFGRRCVDADAIHLHV